MAKIRLTCKNCGFGDDLDKKRLKERMGSDGVLTCPACGAPLTLPEEPRKDKKARYAGLEAMTGLDDVLEDEIPEETQAAEDAGAAESRTGAQATEDHDAARAPAPAAENASAAQTAAPAPADGNEPPRQDVQDGQAGSRPAQAAGAARERLRKTIHCGRENPLFAAEILDRVFRGIAAGAEGRFDQIAAISMRVGHCALLGVSALALVLGVLISLRSLSLEPLLAGLTLSAMLLFAQYLALRAFELLATYIAHNPSRLPGEAITHIFSAFSLLAGLLALISGLILTLDFHSPAWLGLAALGVIGGYFSAAALLECQARLNVSLDAALPWSEILVETASTLLKAAVAVTPFIFGLGSAAMSLCMIWPVVSMLLFGLNGVNTGSFFLQESGLLFCAFSPIMLYFCILFWAFILQAARALLGAEPKK